MDNRIAKVVFSRTFLHNGLDKEDLIDIINALPEDATLIGISEDLSSMNVGMVFHSEEFKEVPECQMIPSIIPHFYKYDDEYGVLDYLDMSQALDPDYGEKRDENGNLPGVVVFDTETSGISAWKTTTVNQDTVLTEEIIQNALKSMSENCEKWYFDQLFFGSWVGEAKSNGRIEYISPYEVFHLPETSPLQGEQSFVLSKKCSDHEWKSYEGFTQKYEYCIHCDEKRNA